VGDINWNKNIYGLLSAFSLLKDKLAMHKEKLCDPLKLVLVGGAFLNFSIDETRKIQKLIKDLKIENDVIMPGFVENAKLAAFYSLAVCYIQPSFYEGFGLPVLDALICGCPVVCSKNSSLSEVGGHFVTYFNPDDIYDMADKIGTIVEIDASSRRLLILKGIGWANNFSWNKVADDTIKCYQEAYKNL
jgi:glycosyltransferase involved in cell wall biosynthesis